MSAATATGIALGSNKGHIVTRRPKKDRPTRSKGRASDRVKLVRGVVREVVGYAPYERRIMEILKGGGNNPNKRAWRFAKLRLGTHHRAKAKVAEMTGVNQAMAQRRTAAAKERTRKKEAKAGSVTVTASSTTGVAPMNVEKDEKKEKPKKAPAEKKAAAPAAAAAAAEKGAPAAAAGADKGKKPKQ